ncbi:hypothetical protein BDY21DRAFT_333738 [Lineolata rhizophorae]|uniref:Uncharacterized protein n=1 Tax=Lineolata rhizophorae TaxID=578093 RepID=A0A6A6PAB3_9PEZI|nr:hypothetical protein BDY21DRAFT_333738 [Lineolata rhizophorae]
MTGAGGRNCLDTLPAEVSDNILSYLIGPYVAVGKSRSAKDIYRTHPFNNLAATCKSLRTSVESYCQHILHRYMGHVRGLPPKDARRKRDLSYRMMWIKLVRGRCIFCRKGTQMGALFYPEISCCRACDRKEYPNKITLTDAKSACNLSTDQLTAKALVVEGHRFFRPRFCRANLNGVFTTLFFRDEVEKLSGEMDKLFPRRILKARKRLERLRASVSEATMRSSSLNITASGATATSAIDH